MLYSTFHEALLYEGFPSLSINMGPISWKFPIYEEDPGPPLSQMIVGYLLISSSVLAFCDP